MNIAEGDSINKIIDRTLRDIAILKRLLGKIEITGY